MHMRNHQLELIRQDIVKNHLKVTALIQDIQECTGPLEVLNELNIDGRKKMAALRSSIEQLMSLAETEVIQKEKVALLAEIEAHKSELSTSFTAFRKANVVSACIIDKLARQELLSMPEEQESALRKRQGEKSLVNASNQITDRMYSISRYLAETTQKGADTLDTLLTSSEKVINTKEELGHQQQAILQSGKLLGKYGRREVTDKVLLALALAFFLLCVFYVLQKRLF